MFELLQLFEYLGTFDRFDIIKKKRIKVQKIEDEIFNFLSKIATACKL